MHIYENIEKSYCIYVFNFLEMVFTPKRLFNWYAMVGANINWCSHYVTVWRLLKKSKIELPCETAIPLLGIYLKEIK